MNKELARIIGVTAFRSSADMGHLVTLLKEHCSEEERKLYGIAIATAIATIQIEVLSKIFAEFPELQTDFDRQIKEYGRPF
ncbi:hypothetical protein [Undibacterium sp. Ren11W]|uniref:hypothetical protein n=1 Tax=Undibacterium sp. Ren11W TaxID=3413045 RepID=UPI003BF20AEE